MQRKDFEGAFKDFDRAVQLDPDHWQNVYERGRASFRKGDIANAKADYTLAVEAPKSQNHQKTFGKLTFYDYKDPERLNERILANPDDLEAHELRAGGRIESGDYDGAIADCNAALKIGGKNSDFFLPDYVKNAEGRQLFIDNPESRPRLIASRKSGILYTRGLAWFKKGDSKKAMADYEAHWEVIFPRSEWTTSAPPQSSSLYYDGREPIWVFDDGPIRMELRSRQ